MAVTIVALAVIVGSGIAQDDRPNLMTSAAAEPPDFEISGGQFRMSFTISNEGDSRARRSTVVRAFFSRGRRFDRNDFLLGRGAVVPAIPAGGQVSGRLTARIPANIPAGTYYLITCADATDRVRESTNLNNCLLSGQKTSVDIPSGPGPAGPQGPQGPKGDPGPAGFSPDIRRIPRTIVAPGTRDIDDPATTTDEAPGDIAPDEGSTTTRDLLKVGPITFRGLCLAAEGAPVNQPREAKLLVYTDSGTMNINGSHGPRGGIPPGLGTAGEEGTDGGEGKRLLLATDQSGAVFRGGEGWITTTEGVEIAVNELYIGIGVLGAATNDCVFGGSVRVVSGA